MRIIRSGSIAEIEEPIDASEHVALTHVIVEVEGVEQPVLRATLLTHHLDAPNVSMGFTSSENDD